MNKEEIRGKLKDHIFHLKTEDEYIKALTFLKKIDITYRLLEISWDKHKENMCIIIKEDYTINYAPFDYFKEKYSKVIYNYDDFVNMVKNDN